MWKLDRMQQLVVPPRRLTVGVLAALPVISVYGLHPDKEARLAFSPLAYLQKEQKRDIQNLFGSKQREPHGETGH